MVIHSIQYCMDDVEARYSHGKVRQVALPPVARALSTLPRVDYSDAFLVEFGATQNWSAEQWARAVLDDAPVAIRTNLLLGWSAIGLKPATRGSVLGWEIRVSTPDFVLLGRDSLIGMPGELLFKREPEALLFATFVHHANRIARKVWAAVEPTHVRIVRHVLELASRRLPAAGGRMCAMQKEIGMLAFRRAVEAHELDEIGELFAEDIVFHSPIAFKPYYGREMVSNIIRIAATIFEDFAYQREIGAETDDAQALVFGARIGDLSIQGCDFLHTDADGLIDEFTVMLRPLRAVHAFEEQMRVKFAAAMAPTPDNQRLV
jgi:SnoaL-like protein